ncbi:MAG: flagellar FliJ family protein [Vampirovibrionales bacterium]|nr:flagellar FliJ family protein [Vampirovibrionales bacterium]
MPFRYRLQNIYNMRERKKKEQEQVVNEAQNAVRKVQVRMDAKIAEREDVRHQRKTINPMMLDTIDKLLVRYAEQIVEIKTELDEANRLLKEEEEKLAICRQELEALEKHKERAKEEWLEEEKQAEMKMLDEVASQRYFRQMVESAQEAIELGEDD